MFKFDIVGMSQAVVQYVMILSVSRASNFPNLLAPRAGGFRSLMSCPETLCHDCAAMAAAIVAPLWLLFGTTKYSLVYDVDTSHRRRKKRPVTELVLAKRSEAFRRRKSP